MNELNSTGWLISIELLAFCTMILVVLFVYSLKFITQEQFKTSKLILLVNLCYGFLIDTDIINVIYNWYPTRINEFAYAVHIVRYVMYISAAMFWFLYCQREFDAKLFTKKIYVFLACLPAAIVAFHIILTPMNGMMFSVTPAGIEHGPYYIVMQIVAYLYILAASLMALIRMIRTRDKDERKRNLSVIIYAIPLIASDILQSVTGYPFLCIGVVIALTMVFVNLIIDEYYRSEKRELEKKQRRDSLLNGLTEDYEAVFIVDVDTDRSKPIRVSDSFILNFSGSELDVNKAFTPEEVQREINKAFSERMKEVIDAFGVEEEKDELISQFVPENVWERLKNDKSFALSYRIKSLTEGEIYYRAKFVRLEDQDGRRFVIGFRNDDAQVRAEMELEKLREERVIKERTSKLHSIIEAMTSEYEMLAIMNLETGELEQYRESDYYKAGIVFGRGVRDYKELLGRFADEFIDEDGREDFIRAMGREVIIDNLKEKKNYYVRFRLKGFDEWYEVNLSSYDEVTGNVVFGSRNIDVVISEERQREQLRRELEDAKQHEIIGGLSLDFDCVSYIDVNNGFKETFYRTSPTFYNRIPDWAKKAGFGKRMEVYSEIFVVPEDREKFLAEVNTDNLLSRFDERLVYFVNFRINVDDEIRYYQIKFTANKVGGKIQSIIAGFHDVDDEMKEELKRQELLENAKELAEEGNRAKTMFLFNMSHDIRTPMNAIIGFTNMAMKNIDNRDKALDALGKTMDSSEVLLSLINQILDMSRIESGKVELAEDKANMTRFGRNVRAMLEELALAKKINFTFNIDDISDKYVVLDMTRVDEIIVNIVSNAIKYTQEGGNVDVSVRQLGRENDTHGLYEFKVADNGYGMSKEFQKHLFEDFSREETIMTNGIQGTGLGLPLVKRLVDLMGGDIFVESEQNIGSTFTLNLPFKLREHDNFDEEKPITAETEEKFVGKRILLAEDNELNREIALDILSEDGFVVEEARDGKEACDMVRDKGEDYYDFILMDIRMPIMDGYEATKNIRGLCKNKHIPIIALSANAFEEDRAKSIKVGMDDHVAKPIEVETLKKTLARFI